jgi:hypothetical protein
MRLTHYTIDTDLIYDDETGASPVTWSLPNDCGSIGFVGTYGLSLAFDDGPAFLTGPGRKEKVPLGALQVEFVAVAAAPAGS